MAAEDWKGVAMILQTLGQMTEPSKLDVMERQYELESLEKQADRKHEFMLKNYETMQEKYSDMQDTYQAKLNKGQALNAELENKKDIDYTGNAGKVMEQIYGGQYTNFEKGMKTMATFIDELQGEIVLAEQVNKAGTIGKDFAGTWAATGADDKQINYAKDFDVDKSGDLNYDEKMLAIDAETIRRYGEEEEDQSYDQGNAFKLVAKGQVDAEKELGESKVQSDKENKLTDIEDAKSAIPNIVNAMKVNPLMLNEDGELDFAQINSTPSLKENPTYKLYNKHMAVLAESGQAYLYRPPQLNLSNFKTSFNQKAKSQAELKGYGYVDYKMVTSGLDKQGAAVPAETFKRVQREFEWAQNTKNMTDNQETFNPDWSDESDPRKISVGMRRAGFLKLMREVYGK